MSELSLYTIYANPKDYPGRYVLRRWIVGRDPNGPVADPPLAVADTLVEVRAALPPGLTNLRREVCDDPVIVETWV